MATDNRTPTPEETPPVILDGQISMFRETAAADQDDEQTPPDGDQDMAVRYFEDATLLMQVAERFKALETTAGDADPKTKEDALRELAGNKYTAAFLTVLSKAGEEAIAANISDKELRSVGISPLAYKRWDREQQIAMLKGVNLFVLMTVATKMIADGRIQPYSPTKAPTRRQLAKSGDAYMQVDLAQALITSKPFSGALFPRVNETAYITLFDSDFREQLRFVDGRLSFDYDTGDVERLNKQVSEGLHKANSLDIPVLTQIFTIMYQTRDQADKETIPVYLPSLAKAMDIAIYTPDLAKTLIDKIMSFENVIGVMQNGSFYRCLLFNGYNAEDNTVSLSSPYMRRLLQAIATESRKVSTSGKEYEIPAYSFLVKSSIAGERNKTAVHVVYILIAGLQQRGTVPDSELHQNKPVNKKSFKDADAVTYRVSFKHIIEMTPLLKDRLDATKSTANKNKVLQRAFDKAIALLRTQTTIYEYYKDLSVSYACPTMTQLDTVIRITHHGQTDPKD